MFTKSIVVPASSLVILFQVLTMTQRLIRLSDVTKRTGIPKSTIYALLKNNRFPRPVPLTTRCVAFVESEIEAWIDQRIAERDVA